MKTIMILLLLGCSGLFFACQDVTVGYLHTDIAGYTPDTLRILNVKKEIVRLQGILDEFKELTAEDQEQLTKLTKQIKELQESMEALDKEYGELLDELYDYDNPPTPAREEEILARLDELDMFFDEVWKEIFLLQGEQDEINEELKKIAEGLGMDDPLVMEKKISDYQDRIDFELPWTSAPIQGVQGTEPLQYSVIGVKSANMENAAKFMTYAGVIGGGRIYVSIDVDVPVGAYSVTLEIKNEGRTIVLEDVFTFVVMDEIDETGNVE